MARACLLYLRRRYVTVGAIYRITIQKQVTICSKELAALDMSINGNKSVSMRMGPRFIKHCSNIGLSI